MRDNLSTLSSNEVLERLLEGNARFAAGALAYPNQSPARRSETLSGQNPAAVVLTCSDSRVCPELIFDQGIGDLYVVRTAGNVIDRVGLGSIEYAIVHLDVKLIIVLGHEDCGAVKASFAKEKSEGNITAVTDTIKPAVQESAGEDNQLDRAIRLNNRNAACRLAAKNSIIGNRIESGLVRVVKAFYHILSGKVEIIDS